MNGSSVKKKNLVVLTKETIDADKIKNFFMNSYWSKTGIFVKLMREASMKVQHSTRLRGENWLKIKILSWNSLARYRNCRKQFIEWFERCSRCWISAQWTFSRCQSTSVFPTSCSSWWNVKPFYRNAEPKRWAPKHLGHTWWTHMVFRETFLQIQPRLLQHLIRRNWFYGVFIYQNQFTHHRRGEWEQYTSSGSEMPVWTVSQKFSHLQWRRLFKELWCRPTTTADIRSSFREVANTSHICLLEDKIQDWGMYMVTIPQGSYAMDPFVENRSLTLFYEYFWCDWRQRFCRELCRPGSNSTSKWSYSGIRFEMGRNFIVNAWKDCAN